MKVKVLIAVAVAAAFPMIAQAAGDKAKSDASASQGSSAAQGSSGASGAEAMFKAMDKNNDGMVTREEAKGTPHDKDFAKLDKNNDGKLSREEHAAAPEHANEKAATGGTAKSESKAEGKTEKPKY